MYDTLKLEKGMYHLANQSFSQALEHMDPSAQYHRRIIATDRRISNGEGSERLIRLAAQAVG